VPAHYTFPTGTRFAASSRAHTKSLLRCPFRVSIRFHFGFPAPPSRRLWPFDPGQLRLPFDLKDLLPRHDAARGRRPFYGVIGQNPLLPLAKAELEAQCRLRCFGAGAQHW